MQPDPEDLRRHYASLTDEALLDLDRADLTEIARTCYDAELFHRDISHRNISHRDDRPNADPNEAADANHEEEPEWLEDAACACSFESSPGNDAAPDLDDARSVLEAAGVPCYAVTRELGPPGDAARRRYSYELMVPGALNLKAVSALDKEFFNPRLEADWRTHFAALSDEELRALNLEDLTAGLMDRVERLTNTYNDEAARREE